MATPASQEVNLTLPIRPDMEMTASKTAIAMAESMGMGADKIDEVGMAVVEACINAFEHSGFPEGKVRIFFTVAGDSLTVRVENRGRRLSPSRHYSRVCRLQHNRQVVERQRQLAGGRALRSERATQQRAQALSIHSVGVFEATNGDLIPTGTLASPWRPCPVYFRSPPSGAAVDLFRRSERPS